MGRVRYELSLIALVWIGCAGLAAAGVVGYWRGQSDRAYFVDEGVYTYVGWSWSQGHWPYRDVFDHKGPTLYLTTMARTALAGTNARFLGAQEIIVGVTMAILLATLAHLLWGGIGPPVALAFGVLVWAQRPLVDFGTGTIDPAHIHMSTPGSLIALFSTAAILCALAATRRATSGGAALLAALTGALGALAMCTKLNAVAGFIVALVVLAVGDGERPLGWRVRLLGWSIVGAAAPPAAFALLFLSAGVLRQFVDVYLLFNAIRGAEGFAPRDWLFLPIQIERNLNYAGIATITVVVLIASAIAALYRWFASGDAASGLTLKRFEIIIPAWLLLELGVWLSNGGAFAFRVYPVLPAAALGATWLVIAAARSPVVGRQFALVVFLLIAVPSALTLDPLHARARQVPVDWTVIVRDLRKTTTDADTILSLNSWRAPSIMSLAERRTASPHISPMSLYVRGYANDARWGEVVDLVNGSNAPRVILIGAAQKVWAGGLPPTVDQVVAGLRQPDVRPGLIDRTVYPNLTRLQERITARYRLDYCVEEVCLLWRRDDAVPSAR